MWNDAADAGAVYLRALVSLFIKLFLCNTLYLAGYLLVRLSIFIFLFLISQSNENYTKQYKKLTLINYK